MKQYPPFCFLFGLRRHWACRSAGLLLLLLLWPLQLRAAEGPSSSFSWYLLLVGFLGGLAFFLYGMEKMSAGMKKTAGNRMRSILASLTSNRIIALLVGAFVTMVIQSSSATTVMLVGFVQAEMMRFVQCLGVILGANIGTTITAQLVAFKLTDYALVMLIAGFTLRILSKNERTKSLSDILFGLGILFYGMKMMSDSMEPLRSNTSFLGVMEGLRHPLAGILAGTIFTALVQSSSAATGVVIVLAQQGLLTIEAGIPIILGANIGTCITAGLAGIGTSREAKRVALAHTLFNTTGVLLFSYWIPQFATLLHSLGGISAARQIANAHTLFNLAVALLFLPFLGPFARLIERLLPDPQKTKGLEPATWHLDDALISTPAIAMRLARNEIARMAKILIRMHQAAIRPFLDPAGEEQRDAIYPDQLSLLEGIAMREKKINFLEEQIRRYVMKITRQELAPGQGREVNCLISLLDAMERIGDIIVRQMVVLVKKKRQLDIDFSDEGKEELLHYHEKIGKQLDRLLQVLENKDISLAQTVKQKMASYALYDAHLRKHHLERMLALRKGSMEAHSIHIELMDALGQINFYCGEIARHILRCHLFNDNTVTGRDNGNGQPTAEPEQAGLPTDGR